MTRSDRDEVEQAIPEKARLLDAVRQAIRQDLEALERRQRDTVKAATHEENRAEHAKDTRATEQSYLARGLAERVADLQKTRDALAVFEPPTFAQGEAIAVGALVVLASTRSEGEPQEESWFLVPAAGGLELDEGPARIRTLTPVSPLGRTLIGLCSGDERTVRTPSGEREIEVLSIR